MAKASNGVKLPYKGPELQIIVCKEDVITDSKQDQTGYHSLEDLTNPAM